MWILSHCNIRVQETLRLFVTLEENQEPHISQELSIYIIYKQTEVQAAGIITLQLLKRTHLHFTAQ